MSFVGTRPEVKKYVNQYTPEMYATLLLPAGVTSLASIEFKDEDEILERYTSKGRETNEVYVKEVLPLKMEYNLKAITSFNFYKRTRYDDQYCSESVGRKMENELVSIIMPSWNTGNFIAESIQSVINQTYKNWELIIVDDCSTDNTDEVVSFYKDQRIKYLKNEKNSGAAITRNKALREAQGEWIAFLDSDDLWAPEKLEHQINFMKNNGYNLSFTEYEKIDEESKPLNVYVSGPEMVNKRKMYNYDYIGQLTMMYSTKAFGLIQIKDIKKNNDYAIRLQLYKRWNMRIFVKRKFSKI